MIQFYMFCWLYFIHLSICSVKKWNRKCFWASVVYILQNGL